MHLYFIINPNASTLANRSSEAFIGDCRNCLQAIPDADAPDALTHELLIPDSPAQLQSVLSERLARGGVDRIVICGGDGTIASVLPVMARYPDIPLALLPVGTGNLLALNLGVPSDISEALRIAVGNKTQAVDLARMNEDMFILNASVGIDAEIMEKTDKEFKKRWGLLAYFIRGIPLVTAARLARLRIEVDGRLIRARGIGITVFNAGSMVASGIRMTPDTRPDDGLLDGVVFKPKTWADYFFGLVQVVTTFKKRKPVIQHISGKVIRIEAQPALKTQVDGNVVGTTPVLLEILPQQLHICIP